MKNLMVYGDSIMVGIVCDNGRYTVNPNSFINLLTDKLGIKTESAAQMGRTVHNLGKMIDRTGILNDETFDTVFVEYGGNDADFDWQAVSDRPDESHSCRTERGFFIAEYVKQLKRLKSTGKDVYVLSLPPCDPKRYYKWIVRNRRAEAILGILGGDVNMLATWHETYNFAVFKAAAEAGVKLIDITTCFYSQPNYERFLCDDGIHLNDEGNKLVFEAILSQL